MWPGKIYMHIHVFKYDVYHVLFEWLIRSKAYTITFIDCDVKKTYEKHRIYIGREVESFDQCYLILFNIPVYKKQTAFYA